MSFKVNRITDAQRRLLNAICDDLARSIVWYGFRLSKDDWRRLICATKIGARMVPGINTGEGEPGFVVLSKSSLELSKDQAADAITTLLELGDNPSGQGLTCEPVKWSKTVLYGLGLSESDIAA